MNVDRWARVLPWEPTSSKQVLLYLRSKGYPIAKHRKTKKDTSNNEALEKLQRKFPEDPIIPIVQACRDLQKADGYLSDTYVGLDGRFHPELTQHPETLRFSARRPNVTNQPKPEKFKGSTDPRKMAKLLIAEAIISSIEATPGFMLIERDFKAQESLLLGYFAGDENYMRMARLGIYSFFLARKQGVGIDLTKPDGVVKAELGKVKSQFPFEYPIMKKTILARGYGEGIPAIAKDLEPFFMEDARREVEKSRSKRADLLSHICADLAKAAAAEYVKVYEAAAPKVVQFQTEVRERAHKERKLTNPYGYTKSFFDVFSKRGGKWVLGSEANKALAFLPQSTGAGILKECMLELDAKLGADPQFHMLIPEHDKLVCEAPEVGWVSYMSTMREVMEGPIPALGGLTIETEGKYGRNWGLMRECS